MCACGCVAEQGLTAREQDQVHISWGLLSQFSHAGSKSPHQRAHDFGTCQALHAYGLQAHILEERLEARCNSAVAETSLACLQSRVFLQRLEAR